MLLEAALQYARDGVPVFPVTLPSKRPLCTRGFHDRTTDEAQIRAWWAEWPDAAIGLVPIDQNAVVIDIDNGWEGVPETKAFVDSLPPTRTARSLRGGQHRWLSTYNSFSNGKPFPFIDIRSGHGYVVAPPSPGYTWTVDTEMVDLPDDVLALLRKASPDEAERDPIGWETGDAGPAAGARAQDLLARLPAITDGWKVACTLRRDLGLPGPVAMEMWQAWQRNFAWKWSDADIQRNLANAGIYGKHEPGAANVSSLPAHIQALVKDYTAADWIKLAINPKVQLIGPICTDSRAILAGPTGLGKTHLAMAIAFHVAAGKQFLHWPVPRPARVMYFDGEMARSLIKERVIAARSQVFTPGQEDWLNRIWIYSTLDVEGLGGFDTAAGMSWVEEKITQFKPDLVIFDNKTALMEGDTVGTNGIAWGQSWQNMLPMVKWITGRGIAQIWVDHAENDRIIGAKKNRYQIDTEVMMRAVDDAQGVEFDLWFGKSRERTPQNAALYEAGRVKLYNDKWTYTAAEEIVTEQIRMVLTDAEDRPGDGWSTKQMIDLLADALDLTKDAAKKKLDRARRAGLVSNFLVLKGKRYLWRLP